MKFYGYIRVSTETQSEKGYGLNAQRNEIIRYASKNKLSISGFYSDAGISGNIHDDEDDDAINRRSGLIELLTKLKPGDSVIVLNTSRLWRSDMTKAIVRRELIKRGAKVISIEQPRYDLYSKDPNNYLINSIMEALDVYERMTISLKLARGRAEKAVSGAKPAGVCPFGYRYSGDKKSVEIIPEEAAIVKSIFSYAQQGYTLKMIADTLNGENITTRRGNWWNKGSVHAVLRNRFYIGELRHAGRTVKGIHQAIISRTQFKQAGAQLDRKRKRQ